ncbi:MAG TPA: hypothetical protein VNT26_14040, partial [Candidatus Sulfotelmatobacter sp.]|nr:hypothetical protein [Candidatus Sulfotelmatobacter sp.]
RLTIPVFILYGFFFMGTFPMTEAALMEAVPDGMRGRVFGLFVTAGGVVGNLSHWLAGAKVKQLGEAAQSVSAYYPIYAGLAIMLLVPMAGLLCLIPIRKRGTPEPILEPILRKDGDAVERVRTGMDA